MMKSPAKQIIGLYRRHARIWAAKRATQLGGPMEAPWLDRFLGLLPPRPAVLDIGCGSGEPIGRYLTEKGCDVTGVDSAPEMIAMCTDTFPQQTWAVGDMRRLSLGRSFNGILAWDSFFHLRHDDQRQMFPIFRKHAAPRAALLFTSGPGHGEAIGMFEGEPLYHASLDYAEYRNLLDQNDFAVVEHMVEDPACGHHTVWLAQHR
jgi:SAM-dependent methyltransferase